MTKKLKFIPVKIERINLTELYDKRYLRWGCINSLPKRKSINCYIFYDIIDKSSNKLIKRTESLNQAKRYCILNNLNYGYL